MTGRRSVYEDRESAWLDRLRRRFGGGGEDEHQEPALNESGEPTYVVVKGELLGVRDTRGGIIKIPQPPADRPDLWPDDWWGDGREIVRHEIVVPIRSIRPWR